MSKTNVINPYLSQATGEINAFFTLRNDDLLGKQSLGSALKPDEDTSFDQQELNEKRKNLFETLGLDPDWTAWAHQIHSNRVKYITDGGRYGGVDALVTEVPGLSLIIQVADCAALLMADRKNKIIAAAHAGWRGAAGDILPNTLQAMFRHGAEASAIEAFVSPCISLENFEVGEEVAEQFPDSVVDRSSYRKPHVDLKMFLKNQLMNNGVPENQIEVSGDCTIANPDKYFSYRREQDKAGRMLGVITIT